MPWIQAHLIVPKEQADIAELVFHNLGSISITLGDAQDEPVLETLPDEIRLWSLVKVTALFEYQQKTHDEIHQAINQAFKQDISRQLTIETLQDQDWERTWLEYFKPMKFGNNLWICPTGHEIPKPDATIIELDPGLAFGTGTHPTTALCLEWLDQHQPEKASVIDYGCGSGILAVAALKLGADRAIGIDYDPQAIKATLENARKNHVQERIAVYNPTETPDIKVDILIANILAGVLIDLEKQLAKHVNGNGQIVLSGILSDQAETVLQAYAEDFKMEPAVEKEGWVRLTGYKRV